MSNPSGTATTVAPAAPEHAGGEKARVFGLLAEFENPGALMRAAEKVRDAGFRKWDCFTPFPVHGLDRAMGVQMTKLPIFVFCCGFAGATLGLVLQWFTNATELTFYAPMSVTGYPFMISGKPFWSLPANIPVIFELTILLSAFGAVFGMLGLNGLPHLYHPYFKSRRFRRVTIDRYFIGIETTDPKFDSDRTRALLENAGASNVEALED